MCLTKHISTLYVWTSFYVKGVWHALQPYLSFSMHHHLIYSTDSGPMKKDAMTSALAIQEAVVENENPARVMDVEAAIKMGVLEEEN